MIRSTEEFRAVVKAARRVGTPLVAVRTADPASAITQVCEAVNGKQDPPPLLIWDFIGGLQGRNDAGKSAVAKVLGENSPVIGPGDALAIAQRIASDAILFFLNPQRVWEQPDVVQGIWSLRDIFKAGGQMLVLVTTPFDSPGTEPAADRTNAPSTLAITDPGLDLPRKTVCIKVRLSTMGNTRKVSTAQIETDADKDLLRVSKRLVDSAELKAITRFDGEIRRFLYNICLPFEIGIHLLPITALETVEYRLRQFAEDRKQLVQAFLTAYPSLYRDAERRLRGLYDPTEYPQVDDVAREFGFTWQYVSFGVPDQLKGISREVWGRSGRKPRCAWPKRRPKSRSCFASRWQNSCSTWLTG